ncbi:MAG: ankyrin repeat domain-containing protein, partial [Thermoanaerobaculia bacterium]
TLLAAGADPAAKDRQGNSVLKTAENSRSARAIDLLRDAKKVNVAPVAPRAAASGSAGASASSGDPKKELDRLGFKFDSKTFFNRVEAGDVRAIELFLKAGFDSKTREQGRPALYVAVDGGHAESVKALIAGGADVNDAGAATDKRFESGETLVMKAVDGANADIVRALVEAGSNVNRGNMYKVNPLMSAARQGHADIVEILLSGKADVNTVDQGGSPALLGPVQESHADIVRMLLKAGAKVGKHRKLLLDYAKDPAIKKMIKEAA